MVKALPAPPIRARIGILPEKGDAPHRRPIQRKQTGFILEQHDSLPRAFQRHLRAPWVVLWNRRILLRPVEPPHGQSDLQLAADLVVNIRFLHPPTGNQRH